MRMKFWLLALCAPVVLAAADEAPWRAKLRAFAEAHLKHPAWGYGHALRDYALAKQLAEADKARVDDDALYAAAMLHDLAAFPGYAKEGVDHSDQAAELVGPILAEAGFPMAKLPAVQAAIRTHMYYRDPMAPEALYLHDADALDWLGAIGVARVTATVDPQGGQPDGAAAVKFLQSNLEKVPARVMSPAGKALLPDRQAALKAYLDRLARESEDYHAL